MSRPLEASPGVGGSQGDVVVDRELIDVLSSSRNA